MRHFWWLAALAVAACSSSPPDASNLTLKDRYWDRVNVEIVITRRDDCDSRDEGYLSSREFKLRKDQSEAIEVPNGAKLCWRHDRNPNNPVAGAWSGWTKATVNPGQSAETDL